MKKTILFAALAGLAMAACKKDRVCSCRTVTTVTGGQQAGTFVEDRKYTILDASRKTAYYACTHKKFNFTDGSVNYSIDQNCSLE
jgi:hypothetical protein